MLRITQSSNVDAARSYYTQGLSREDYYSHGQEIVGRWGGKGAMRLGLHGTVTKDAFDALCQNRHPETGDRLTPRTKGNRRVGYDFNFHVPKSVSACYALTEDPRILESFRTAVRDTMSQIETDSMTQVRRNGETCTRTTGNLVFGEFVHFTARPVGGTPDPHLHAHCFAFNATWDQNESRFKACEFGNIKRDGSFYEAAFHSRLSKSLADHGYAIRRTAKGWELAGVPANAIKAFSRRTHQIESLVAARGITDTKTKAALGARTRQKKQPEKSASDLRREWESRLTVAELAAIREAVPATKREVESVTASLTPSDALHHAKMHCFERESVVPERHLLTQALKRGYGELDPADVDSAFQEGSFIHRDWGGRRMVTTPEVACEERAMLRFAREGRGTQVPLAAAEEVRSRRLNAGQREAVRHVWDSSDRVIVIRGGAGTGKTTLMREAVRGIEAHGKRVIAMAPTAEASRGVLRAEGFEKANTIAMFLQDEAQQSKAKGHVLWIDEAGLIGTRTMGRVFAAAERLGCRVVLSGDTKQHAAVERGDALRLLEHHAGVRPVEVTEIVRQRGDYRSAVASLAKGDVESAFEQLESMGAIREASDLERHAQLAGEYLETVQCGKTALVVAPTHAEGERVTGIIRQGLRHEGHLKGSEREFEQLRSLRWTEAERSDPARYSAGMTVQFHLRAEKIKAGERCVVVAADDRRVTLEHKDGARSTLPLAHASRFEVYERGTVPVAPGELLRITRNGKSADGIHALNNGAIHRVAGFSQSGNLRLENGWEVSRDFGHLTHGYCTTSHASQGKTVDRVFIAQGTESFTASSREQFYVSVSRARESVVIYTNDKAGLRAAVAESGARVSAMDLLRGQDGSSDRSSRLMGHALTLQRWASQAKEYAIDRLEKVKTHVSNWIARTSPQGGLHYER